MKNIIIFFLSVPFLLTATPISSRSMEELYIVYQGLDPTSISELLSFYHLYSDTDLGKKALTQAWMLMTPGCSGEGNAKGIVTLPNMDLQSMIAFVNKQPFENPIALEEKELELIEKLSSHLGNRKLKGFYIWEIKELPLLSSEEIDLARALLLHQFEREEKGKQKIREYEASLDLMALQILARLKQGASAEEKIGAINHLIFYEKKFRFPPHSLMAKEIDTYTFLPSVLDSRKGVCLGVSILYLSLAQRLNLPLEIITPPGHIYLSYEEGEKRINIETTARGVSFPSKTYLGINTRKLQTRTMKEVVGLAFINQASVSWHREEYQEAVSLYEKAIPYLPNDPLLKLLLGYNYLFIGEKQKGEVLLKEVAYFPFDEAVYKETGAEDYLKKRATVEGIKTVFSEVDETRESIIAKQEKLKKVIKETPLFREGVFHLAITYLQLGREKEALELFLRYHAIDPNNPVVEYYLSTLCTRRFFYKKAWEHLKAAEKITLSRNHKPECLKSLRHSLRTLLPDPEDHPSFDPGLIHAASTDPLLGRKKELESNLQQGKILKLADGSLWEVAPQDLLISQSWILSISLSVEASDNPSYPYFLINEASGSKVHARPI